MSWPARMRAMLPPSDHRQLGIEVWGTRRNLVRFGQGNSIEEARSAKRFGIDGRQLNRAELLATGNHGSGQSP